MTKYFDTVRVVDIRLVVNIYKILSTQKYIRSLKIFGLFDHVDQNTFNIQIIFVLILTAELNK